MRKSVVFAFAAAGLVLFAQAASAHAVLVSSAPADGAALSQAPSEVSIAFTESPDQALSSILVLDSAGRAFQSGKAAAVAGQPSVLRVGLKELPKGVYTVSWRVVSKADGHLTAGAFAFGVGAAPGAVTLPKAASTPKPSALGVGARLVFYAGLMLLLGVSWVGAFILEERSGALQKILPSGAAATGVGIAAITLDQVRVTGVSLKDFLSTSIGRSFLVHLAPFVFLVAAVVFVSRFKQKPKAGFIAAGVFTGMEMGAHVVTGHAAAGSWAWAKVTVQWVHFAAVGTWLGGLAALLIAIRGAPSEAKAPAVKRYSFVAGVCLALVAGTGIWRAVDQVGSWGKLTTTGFGELVLVKAGLLVVLAGLGAVNRYRNVPVARTALSGLRRAGSAELAVAAGVLGVTGVLVGLAPAKYSKPPAPPSVVATTAADFATTVRVRLEARPGLPGPNRFRIRVTDYDRGTPIGAGRVSLRFEFPARPGVGGSTLDLRRTSAGVYEGSGSNLSLDGRWKVTALIERGAASVEVPLRIQTKSPPEQISVSRAAGQPTLYTVALPGKRSVQIYLDPTHAGPGQFHATFFDASGNGLVIGDESLAATPPSGDAFALDARKLDTGHFVADVTLTKGEWRFDVTATAGDGEQLAAYMNVTVSR
jgi:copper transport protein